MSSRAHARRRLAAWDRYRRRYGGWTEVYVKAGVADTKWWVRLRRNRRRAPYVPVKVCPCATDPNAACDYNRWAPT